MVKLNETNFLELPDWKKVELKKTNKRFANYPLQTEDQTNFRQDKILRICAHFSQMEYDYFLYDLTPERLEAVWPVYIELHVTPRLMDIVSVDLFFHYGRCFCCRFFGGEIRPVLKAKTNITVFSGKCTYMNNEDATVNTVKPDNCCPEWMPMVFYDQVLSRKIKTLCLNEKNNYPYDQYLLDLQAILILDFFRNNYAVED